jgi:hypothetical protein
MALILRDSHVMSDLSTLLAAAMRIVYQYNNAIKTITSAGISVPFEQGVKSMRRDRAHRRRAERE